MASEIEKKLKDMNKEMEWKKRSKDRVWHKIEASIQRPPSHVNFVSRLIPPLLLAICCGFLLVTSWSTTSTDQRSSDGWGEPIVSDEFKTEGKEGFKLFLPQSVPTQAKHLVKMQIRQGRQNQIAYAAFAPVSTNKERKWTVRYMQETYRNHMPLSSRVKQFVQSRHEGQPIETLSIQGSKAFVVEKEGELMVHLFTDSYAFTIHSKTLSKDALIRMMQSLSAN